MNKKTRDFLRSILLNMAIFFSAAAIYFFSVRFLQSHSPVLYSCQLLEAKLVYLIQRPFADVMLAGTRLVYNGFAVDIVWDCLGIRQSLFFLILVFSFYQVDLRKKLMALYYLPVIILLNLLRIISLYPMFVMFGGETAMAMHEWLYSYGNGILVLGLFVLWFYAFAAEKCKKDRDAHRRESKKQK